MKKIIPQLCRLYPLHKGRGRIVQTKIYRRFAERFVSPIPVKLKDGQIILVYPLDYTGSMIFLYGDLDPSITWVLRKLIEPGDTVVDVGANVGIVSIQASKLCGHGGRVISFEPNPDVYGLLKQSLMINNIMNVSAYNVALSSDKDTVRLSLPHNKSGSAMIINDKSEKSISIEAERMDSYKELFNGTIKLLKIDHNHPIRNSW